MLGFEKTYTLPFKYEVPNYINEFQDKRSFIKTYLKYIKRYLFLILMGQKNLEVSHISSNHKNILWINISAPSLGDSLMDLSSRILLREKKVDLFTDPKNSNLYFDDLLFSKVFLDMKQVDEKNYDLVIIDSYSTRSVNIKSKIAGSTPYVGVFGYFNGPEVNRVLFSFHKMNKLLQYKKTETEINSIAKSVIFISDKDKKIIKNLRLPGNYIAIALGGEWSYRTYKKWKIVIQKIIENHNGIKIVLLGSKNANYFASEIENNFSNKYIHNCVNKHTFVQTAEIINKANLLLCCDGGLMHAANSVDTPIVALFAKLSQTMQLTSSISAFSLYDNSDVNNIKPTEIFSKFLEASNFFHIDHQDG